MKILFNIGALTVSMICLLPHSAQSRADDFNERRTVIVRVAAHDLQSEEGRGIVYRRLQTAAKQACIDVDSRHELRKALLLRHCVNDAMSKAVAQLSDPTFQEYAAARRGSRSEKVSAVLR